MQQSGHAADGVDDGKGFLHPGGNVFGREIEVSVQMGVQDPQLRFAQLAVAAAVGDMKRV